MLIAIGLLASAMLLGLLQARHVRGVALERRAVLENVQGVLNQPHLKQRGIDYPVLTGYYGGRRVTVALIVDTLALRRLPTLWLSVTVHRPLMLQGPVDILLRPSATDIVSPGTRFAREHEVPPDWPADVRVATPSGVLPSTYALAAALPLLHDRLTKDVLLAPAGARLVTELARAELGHYRVVRRSKFNAHLTGARLSSVLDSLCELTASLEAASPAADS